MLVVLEKIDQTLIIIVMYFAVFLIYDVFQHNIFVHVRVYDIEMRLACKKKQFQFQICGFIVATTYNQ